MEQYQKLRLADKIVAIIIERRKLLWEPSILLLNQETHDTLLEECKQFMDVDGVKQLETYMGLAIIVHPRIRYFTIVDSRSWYE